MSPRLFRSPYLPASPPQLGLATVGSSVAATSTAVPTHMVRVASGLIARCCCGERQTGGGRESVE